MLVASGIEPKEQAATGVTVPEPAEA
jgi:hypothetical protein